MSPVAEATPPSDGSRLHHVGIICPDRQQAETLMSILRLKIGSESYVPAYEADCIFSEGPGGCIELIIPRGGKLKGFNKGAGGLHHIALEVDDLRAESARLEQQGVRLLERSPVDAGDISINFVPPIFTRGVIVELIERRDRSHDSAAPPALATGTR